MTSNYCHQLDEVSKAKYLEKLTFNGNLLPDPLDKAIRPYVFLKTKSLWPSVAFGDIYMYLVETECVYTKEKFKYFKDLESYEYFKSGKVKNILASKIKDKDVCVVTCDVEPSQTAKIHHRPFIVCSSSGIVHNGHCTCMAGLGEICSHVGALLFALEAAIREGPPSKTSVSRRRKKCTKKAESLAVVDIVFNRKGKDNFKKVNFKKSSPSASAAFLKAIREFNPDAPYLTLISDDEGETEMPPADAGRKDGPSLNISEQ